MAEECFSKQIINMDGAFVRQALDEFVNRTGLSNCGLSYAVVAVIGPQSSGKSTLLNHLFNTDFRVMDAYEGRNQTTKGIWIAKCPGIYPFTIAMDLEGTDGSERGEETTFEKQISLFALTVADILLINIWCHDIGREHAANRPLLKIIFEVMMRLFSSGKFSSRKTTLLFVIRDHTKTPVEKLEQNLIKDIEKIWNSITKPEAHRETSFSDFFSVEVTALSSYEDKEEQFIEQVGQLRQRFFNSISPGGLAGDRRDVVPASGGFSISLQEKWTIVKENKDLNLPKHQVMVATVRCEEIANQKYTALSSDKVWLKLSEDVEAGPVPEFGVKLGNILEKYFSEYNEEAMYFDEGVRNAKQQQLKTKALELVHPAYIKMLGHLGHKTLENFKTQLEQSLKNGEGFAASVLACSQSCMLEFDKGATAGWNASNVRDKLLRDIKEHAQSTCSLKLSELTSKYEEQLSKALGAPVEDLLEAGGNDTWPSIRRILKRETENAVSGFYNEVASFKLDESAVETMEQLSEAPTGSEGSLLEAGGNDSWPSKRNSLEQEIENAVPEFSKEVPGFKLDESEVEKKVQNLRDHARNIVEKKARAQSRDVLIRMKDRFSTIFGHDKDLTPRIWTEKEDIEAITKDAH